MVSTLAMAAVVSLSEVLDVRDDIHVRQSQAKTTALWTNCTETSVEHAG